MAKKQMGIQISGEARALLEELAEEEHRSMSNMIERLILLYYEQHHKKEG